jgi:phosphate transport system substrate-binding protein
MKRTVCRRMLHRSLLCLAMLLGACAPSSDGTENQITITGSTSVTPFIEQLAERYQQLHPEHQINVQGLGSSAGIQAAENGTAALGMSSRHLQPEEEQVLQITEIARDALVIIVHPSNGVSNLTLAQVQAIFTGQVQNWSDVGGQDAPITIVTREAGSGTYSAFEELVMQDVSPARSALRQGSNGAVRQIIAEDPDAVGYISLGIVDESVKPVAIDGVPASSEAVRSGTYTLVRPFLFVQRKDAALPPLAMDFVNFTLSPEGQEELVQGGLIQGADAQ